MRDPYPARIYVERDEETNEKRWFSIRGMGVEYVRADTLPALENGPADLADAPSNAPEYDLCSLRKGAEDRIRELEEALRLAAGALQAGQRSMAPEIAFTSEWAHLGRHRVSDILDQADAALVSGSREDGADEQA